MTDGFRGIPVFDHPKRPEVAPISWVRVSVTLGGVLQTPVFPGSSNLGEIYSLEPRKVCY